VQRFEQHACIAHQADLTEAIDRDPRCLASVLDVCPGAWLRVSGKSAQAACKAVKAPMQQPK
jgi:hypothetical protein